MQGIVEGPFYPALYVIVGKWLPKEEKGNLFNLIFVGTPVGSFLCPFVSGMCRVCLYAVRSAQLLAFVYNS